MTQYTFPPQARILSGSEFRRIYRAGRRLAIYPLRFCVLRRRPHRQSRLGMAVSRKVGGAVVRNRWKRKMREAFRLNRHRLRAPYDIVASVDWNARPEEADRVGEVFGELIRRLNAAEGEGP